MAHDTTLTTLTHDLERAFIRWDYLSEFGGSDPFYSDGANMNFVRNHILYCKNQMEKFLDSGDVEPSLFGPEYPQIYYKETPVLMLSDYMVNADEIRKHAAEQLALYEQDPNFCYLRDHFNDVFHQGETQETRSFPVPYYQTAGYSMYRKYVEADNLIEMRHRFSEPYEAKAPKWAEYADTFKRFLSREHSHTAVRNDDAEFNYSYEDECECPISDYMVSATQEKPSLNSIIRDAQEKASASSSKKKSDIQLSLF